MPQPLSKVVPPPQQITTQPDSAARQPDVAALVAQAISIWSLVELTLGQTLVDMLGAKATPAIAMYGALTSTAAQEAALKAAAKMVLSEPNSELFDALMILHRRQAKQRHKFAHWVWAFCEQAPDHLVLIDPIRSIQGHTLVAELRHKQIVDLSESKFEIPWSDEWYCYSKTELRKIIEAFKEVLNFFRWFQHLVSGRPAPPWIVDIYKFLSTQPQIATEIDRLRQARQNTQSKPEQQPPQATPSKP